MSQKACTHTDLATFKRRTSASDDDCSYGSANAGDGEESLSIYVTAEADRMQRQIETSASLCDKMTEDEMKMCWKNCTEDCKAVINSDLSRVRKKDFEREVSQLRKRYMSELSPVETVGGDGRIEMCAGNGKREKRARRLLQSTDFCKG